MTKDNFFRFIARLDASSKWNRISILINSALGVFAVLIKMNVIFDQADPINKAITAFVVYGFITLNSVILLLNLLLLFGSSLYKTIKFRWNSETGALYDDDLRETNVSLRAESLNIILRAIEPDKLYEVGKEVGKSFYDRFINHERQKGDMKKPEKLLMKWQEYDSSSGMGIFRINEAGRYITVSNPFIGECSKSHNNEKCKFLKGYLEGFLSKFFKKTMSLKCLTDDFAKNECNCSYETKE